MKLIKQAGWSTTHVEAFFYRDTEKREVISYSNPPPAICRDRSQVRSGRHRVRRTRLLLLRDKLGHASRAASSVYSGEHTLPIDDRIWAVPSPDCAITGELSIAATAVSAAAMRGGSQREQTLAPHAWTSS